MGLTIIGTYNPPHTRHEIRIMGPTLLVPLADRDGGIADAYYTFEGRDGDGIHCRYRLQRIDEWMPPMSPQEKALMFTDAWPLPPLDENGRIDYKAIAERRRKEWAEARA